MATPLKVLTREKVKCPIFGHPDLLDENILPSYKDVMRYYLFIRQKLKEENGSKPAVSTICSNLAPEIIKIWRKASIPTVSDRRVEQMLMSYNTKYKNLLKSKGKKSSHTMESVRKFKETSENLFDLAACKCSDFSNCTCERLKKVPLMEQGFLIDQRTQRKMFIGGIDKDSTQKLSRTLLRKQLVNRRIVRYQIEKSNIKIMNQETQKECLSVLEHDVTVESCEDDDEDLLVMENKNSKPSTSQMRIKLPSVASICDRTGVSDRAAATIASAVLQDVGIISTSDMSKVIDKNKIRRERKKNREELVKKSDNELGNRIIKGLYFDGRKDVTMIQEKEGNKFYRKTVSEEHICLIEEPESRYLGHVTPKSSTSLNIKQSIFQFFLEKNINISSLTTIGCDGTVTNTGNKNGIITLLEKEARKPLQWIICLFHGNELPLRHLYKFLDGKTTGPETYSGDIGKALENCEKQTVIDFQRIEGNLPDKLRVLKDLSTDQKYLLEICVAVSSGICTPDLAARNPGKLSHSRWLTTANRILRLYISNKNPSENLKTLATYVMKVYAPIWFHIKLKPSCIDGSRHLFKLIQLSRYLPVELQTVVDPVIQRNGYFASPENILLGMLTDERKFIRELALRRILKVRNIKNSDKNKLRKFVIPVINFRATDYVEMILWQKSHITEPPMTMDIKDEELKQLIEESSTNSDLWSLLEFPKFPCHTQAVERTIKLVTEAAGAVCGQDARDGFIHARKGSLSLFPVFGTKKDFKME